MVTKEKTVKTLAGNDGLSLQSIIKEYPNLPQLSTLPEAEPARFVQGRDLESRVFAWLSSNPGFQAIAHSGIEHQYPEAFCELLRKVRTEQITQFCAIPDFLCITNDGDMHYLECKKSRTLEKNVYENYCNLDQNIPTWLLFEIHGKAYIERVSFIQFEDSAEYTLSYRDPFQIDHDGWITSRRNANRSGLPYKAVDFSTMQQIYMEVSE